MFAMFKAADVVDSRLEIWPEDDSRHGGWLKNESTGIKGEFWVIFENGQFLEKIYWKLVNGDFILLDEVIEHETVPILPVPQS